jgi:phosphoglycerate dehydrogenase-like enzyme
MDLDAKEILMPTPFTVLVADFLDESSVESAVFQDVARLELARAMDESELERFLPDADAILLFHDIPMLSDTSLALAPRCKCIVRAGVGYNNVDIQAAARRGIVVCNVPDYGTEEVADHALMFLLAMSRRLLPCYDSIRAGGWDYKTTLGSPRLRGKVFGVIGCGRIGSAAALRAKALGLDVVCYDPLAPAGIDKSLGIRRVFQLEELLEQSHFVSLHCYLNPSTHHLINAQTIARMRPGAYLINTARGPVVEEQALLEALDSGHIEAAGLDVVEVEPLQNERLRNHPKVLLTPHSAFYSVEGWIELRTKAAEEARRILLGEAPRTRVN